MALRELREGKGEMMIDHEHGFYVCDYCGGRNGEFLTETGNHELCEKSAQLKAAKETADALLKEAKNLFDGTLELCDEVNSDEWIWKWRVLYYFEETDIPPHELPEDMKVK